VTEPAIEIHDVSKRFKRYRDRRHNLKERLVRGRSTDLEDFWALRDVDLTIPKGSVYGLIGPNGSGKSTLLKVIAGIFPPTSGKVTSHGRIAALLELGAGFHPDLTGIENIKLNGSIIGLSKREIAAAMDEIIEFSGLEDFVNEPVKHYSSGMYVRLGFSVAVHMNPDILLVDEVIAVGDEDFQRKCFDHLHTLKARGATIVLVSHGLGIVQNLCDEAAWLDHGRLLGHGRTDTVIDSYMAAVNAAEGMRTGAADLAAEVDAAAASEALRRGSGDARIAKVELVDDVGEPQSIAVSGEPVRIRIHYQAAQAVERPVFGLAFQHESGIEILCPNSRFHDLAIPFIEGDGWVDYVLDSCHLNPGTYAVTAAITDESLTHSYDLRPKVYDLRVRPGRGGVRYGVVDLPGNFEWVPVRKAVGTE
jgi:lipopolysaccharide transport system ATP-binding protein